MATPRFAANAYQTTQVESRAANYNQHDLVTMIYEGVIESVTRAKGAMLSGDVSTKIAQVSKAIRLIQEGLIATLDKENGGEIAENLSNLYDYAIIRLTQANLKNDTNMLDEVSNLFKPLLEAWIQIGNDTQGGQNVDMQPNITKRSFASIASRGSQLASAFGQKMTPQLYGANAFAGA